MPFEKGNQFGKGGKRSPVGGRPSKVQQEIKRTAAEIARDYIEKHIDPLLETYIALAVGKVVQRLTPEGKKEFVLDVNPRVLIDAVGKFLPPAKQTFGIADENTGVFEQALRIARERREKQQK